MKNMWSKESNVGVWLFMPNDLDLFFKKKVCILSMTCVNVSMIICVKNNGDS
jgi:hypothetical protein